jgi:hypothetical protein
MVKDFRMMAQRLASFRSGGRHHSVPVGGIIPFRWATSSRYDGRLGQESASALVASLHDPFSAAFITNIAEFESPSRMKFSAHTSFEKEQVSHEKKTTPTPSEAESTASTDGRRNQR